MRPGQKEGSMSVETETKASNLVKLPQDLLQEVKERD
jgi:hypothetical protein